MPKKLTADQKKMIAELLKDMDELDPRQRRVVAQEIVRFVLNDIYAQDLVSVVADTETVGPGEVLEFHTFRNLKAYVVEPGSYSPRTQMIKDKIQLPTHRVTLSTELDLQQLRSGRYGTIQTYQTKAAEALLGRRNKLVWDTLNFSVDSSTPDSNFYSFASGATVAVKKSTLDSAINRVFDNFNGGPGWIMGRYTAVDWIEEIGQTANINEIVTESDKEQIKAAGFVTVYRGMPVFRMRAYADSDNTAMVGANDIWVVSPGTVKFGTVTPGLEVLDEINIDNYSWRINYWEEYGCAILESQKNSRINIT